MTHSPMSSRLMKIYAALLAHFGPQHWWPGETPFEVCVGAILTQNTAWKNVEKAIGNLKQARALTPSRIARMDPVDLAELIRPSGYYNQKARRLGLFCRFLMEKHKGSTDRLFSGTAKQLRPILLGLNGIGPETADSMLLYAGGLPIFVVDAYTRRICFRHGLLPENADYQETQRLFSDHLPVDAGLYNEYHALVVRVGHSLCKKGQPLCEQCPIRSL